MSIGYRFRPTDEELVKCYMECKLVGNDSIVNNITEVDLDTIPPWKLPGTIILYLSMPKYCLLFFFIMMHYKVDRYLFLILVFLGC